MKHFGCPSSKRYHTLGRLFSLTAAKPGCFHSGPKDRRQQVMTSNARGFTYGLTPDLLAQHHWKIGSRGLYAKCGSSWKVTTGLCQCGAEGGYGILAPAYLTCSCRESTSSKVTTERCSRGRWNYENLLQNPQSSPSGSHLETTCQVQSPYFEKEKTEALETYQKQKKGGWWQLANRLL